MRSMTRLRQRVWALGVLTLLSTGFVLADAAPASAHGEGTQQSWVRTTTATFFDVTYGGDATDLGGDKGYQVDVGSTLKVTGKLQISDKWPAVLGGFGLGEIAMLSPGPVLTIRSVKVNGEFVPGSVVMKPGDFFTFEIDLVGRRPGHYHLHPRVDLKGKGPIVGAGTWVRVKATGEQYKHVVTLGSGENIDVERYAAGTVYAYQFLWVAIGLVFVVGWFYKKRLLNRLTLIRRGEDEGTMTTRMDRRFTAVMGVVTLAVILVAYSVAANKWDTIPLQVRREAVPTIQPPQLVDAVMTEARYNEVGEKLHLSIDVKSKPGSPPLTIERLMMGSVSLSTEPYYDEVTDALLAPQPDTAVAPGATQTYTFDVSAHRLNQERLLFTNSAIAQIGGLLVVRGADGQRTWVSVVSDLIKT